MSRWSSFWRVTSLTGLGSPAPSLIDWMRLFPLSGGVCDQVRHVVSSEGAVQTHAGQGHSSNWWIRERQEGEDMNTRTLWVAAFDTVINRGSTSCLILEVLMSTLKSFNLRFFYYRIESYVALDHLEMFFYFIYNEVKLCCKQIK